MVVGVSAEEMNAVIARRALSGADALSHSAARSALKASGSLILAVTWKIRLSAEVSAEESEGSGSTGEAVAVFVVEVRLWS